MNNLKYKSYTHDVQMIDEIYQLFINNIENFKYLIDENDSIFLTNNYSKIDNISNLPKNEQEAYFYLLNMNQTLLIAYLVLEYKVNYFVANLNYQLNYYNKNLKDKKSMSIYVLDITYNLIDSIYSSYIYLNYMKDKLNLKEYTPNLLKIYDAINNIIKTYINEYPECKYNFNEINKHMQKKLRLNCFDKIKVWFNKQFIMFKSYCAWLFEDLSVEYVDVLNRYLKLPIDEHREFYGKIYEKVKDSLNYAIQKYNNSEIINLFYKYREKSFIKQFSEESQKIFEKDIVQITEKEYEIVNNEMDKLIDVLNKDSINILSTMHDSIQELYSFNIRNIGDLCYGYKIFNKK